MAKSLVIVESPAKARTIAGFLGERFVVESSIGHIRDLPKRASDVPAELKKDKRSREVARLGVDVENDFKPLYIVDEEKKSHITRLKALLKEADELLLATDEDREGEAIAWHLSEVLRPKVPVKRMVFHEITKKAIQHALDHPRDIDRHLVDAQEARRILDRLYGYEVSPVLWKKVMPGLSAGRVQSVATRVIVARERERIRFQSAKYWDINGNFLPDTPSSEAAHQKIEANLISVSGQRLATSKDFDDLGRLSKDVLLLDELQAKELKSALDHGTFQVRSVERKPYKRAPAAPFMTSTLQQESGRKLRFSSSRTMKAAQRLYESGYITYMRTDSTTLSDSALTAARSHIEGLYGAHYLPEQPRLYRKKVKNAQEAHEAIRPAGDSFRLPAEVAKEVGPDEAKLYELVWKRTVASQMKDAVGHRLQVRISGAIKRNGVPDSVEFSTSGLTITFPGFLRAYVEGSDDPEAELENRERPLPPVQEGESLAGQEFKPVLHETQPRARFTEASLVRRLEELGVGRPSTYASIISTILAREYAWKRGTALVPSFKAFAVITLLEQHFGGLVDYAFTARMEDQLDAIARGDEATVPWLRRFYFGGGLPANTNDGCQGDGQPTELGVFHGTSQGGESAVVSGAPQAAVSESRVSLDAGLRALVSSNLQAIDARAVNTIVLGEDKDGLAIQVRVGRKFGPYLVRGEDTAQIPEKMPPDELTLDKAIELLDAPSSDRQVGVDAESGLPVLLRTSQYGAYVQLGEKPEDGSKPKTASLFKSMDPAELTVEDALRLLSLPRAVGVAEDGEEILARNGKFGPYISKGKESRTLPSEESIFTVTVAEALELLSKAPTRRRRAAAEPLRELGEDTVSGQTITLRKGRFGPYVTDGETNASLRSSDDPDTLTQERAQELLQLRREAGPSKKRTKKAASKKKKTTTKKKASSKKDAVEATPVTKKKTSKKAATKKASKKKKASS